MKQASTITANRYAFSIYMNNGHTKTDLKCGFVRVMDNIKIAEDKVTLEDGTAWELYCERSLIDFAKDNEQAAFLGVKCIVSFQIFYNGEQIAVARLYREKVTA